LLACQGVLSRLLRLMESQTIYRIRTCKN
jgi:hypothetical protein